MSIKPWLFMVSTLCGITLAMQAGAQQSSSQDGPLFTKGNALVRPADYREWIFLSSGIGMSYDPAVGDPPAGSPAGPGFGNVFVNPSSYRSFMKTGKWPNGTVFILEGRRSSTVGSINKNGWFQTDLAGMEALVKDSRLPDGWAFYLFGRGGTIRETAEPLAGEELKRAQCSDCHSKNAAVEMSFVQFYPTLLEVARQKGPLKAGF